MENAVRWAVLKFARSCCLMELVLLGSVDEMCCLVVCDVGAGFIFLLFDVGVVGFGV